MCYSRHHSRTPPFCPIRGHLTSYHQPMAIEKQDLSKNFWWVENTWWRKQLMTICTTRYPCWKIERILLMTFLSIWWKNYLFIYVYIIYIYRISHGLGLDRIFIQRVVCFLSPSLGPWKLWEILFITCYNTISIFT